MKIDSMHDTTGAGIASKAVTQQGSVTTTGTASTTTKAALPFGVLAVVTLAGMALALQRTRR